MKICPLCAQLYDDKTQYCPADGKKLQAHEELEPTQVVRKASAKVPARPEFEKEIQPPRLSSPTLKVKGQPSENRFFIIGLIFSIVFCLLGTIYFVRALGL